MIGVGLLRGVFLGGIMLWYTLGVWKTVDQYFRDQFQEYLTKELEQNAAMKKDILEDKVKLAARKTMAERLAKLEFSKNLNGLVKPSEEVVGEGGEEGGGFVQEELECGLGEDNVVADLEDVNSSEDVGIQEENREEYGEGTEDNTQPVNYDGMETVGDALCNTEGGEACYLEEHGDRGDDYEEAVEWRNVFAEDEDVCRIEDLGSEDSCDQTGELVDEENEVL